MSRQHFKNRGMLGGKASMDTGDDSPCQLIPLTDISDRRRQRTSNEFKYGLPTGQTLDLKDSNENENFIDGDPVKLVPSWKARKLSKDLLNFQRIRFGEEFHDIPTDRFKMVYLIVMLHGVGTLMPWNMFITANDYFSNYKLGNKTAGPEAFSYREDFLAYLGISSQLPNVACACLNLFIQFGGTLTARIVWTLFIEVIVFIFTIVLAMVDSSSWPGTFFWLTMASAVILNMANGVYQNTVYGIAGKLPMEYSNAVVLGSNISGTLTSIINIISIAASPNIRTAAIYYFLTALLVLLACFDTYFALPLIRFYRYYNQKTSTKVDAVWSRPPYWYIFKKVWPQCLNVFMVFFVTLGIFPNIHAAIKAVDDDFPISETYFAPVTCFLTFNMFAMIGNIIPNWFTWPGPRYLCIPVLLRLLFVPFFMVCNFDPLHRGDVVPLVVTNDWAYFIVAIFFGLSSGYYSSLAMMYAPRCVEPKHAATAGMMAALFLVGGIFSGVNFSLLLGKIVRNDF